MVIILNTNGQNNKCITRNVQNIIKLYGNFVIIPTTWLLDLLHLNPVNASNFRVVPSLEAPQCFIRTFTELVRQLLCLKEKPPRFVFRN